MSRLTIITAQTLVPGTGIDQSINSVKFAIASFLAMTREIICDSINTITIN